MQKMVNGVLVDMTPEEEAARLAEELAWANRHIPTIDEIDTEELNRVLLSEGSVLRAICELMLQEINNLRVRAGLTAYTRQQFVTALRNKMRN